MTAITLAEAKEKLGELIDRVAQGETVEITRDGLAVAQLAPPRSKKQPIDFRDAQGDPGENASAK
ncbi:type II toxin-antitoxin system prevent-host-death family antitoxin [Neorhizobium galegae]|nr:type II toxin-antitoxin system prevent-host-death family antitoxin [Neorhizobium galegae]